MSIIEKAKSLGEAIVASSEYNDMKDAEEKMYADEDASALLSNLEAIQKRVQIAQSNGQQASPKLQKELNTLQSKMQGNEKIKVYLETQKKFNKVMETVNQVISSQLQETADSEE